MKKVLAVFIFILVFTIGSNAQTLSVSPSSFANTYPATPTQLNNSATMTSASSRANYRDYIVGMMPLYPDSTTVDRSLWKNTSTGAYITLPMKVYKSDLTTEVLSVAEAKASGSNLNVFEFSSGKTATNTNFTISILSSASAFAAGTYTKAIKVNLYENITYATWTSGTPVTATATVNLTLTVANVLNVSAKSAENSNSIDFGELSTATSKSFTLQVNSNLPYDLSMTGTNTYNLTIASGTETVPFQVSINGKTYSTTSNPGVIDSVTSIGSVFLFSYSDGQISILPQASYTAGTYSGTIGFTATSR